ncbi:hypothetical protein QW71_09750 [Paenibacillus sp. IHB B 3415]|uniref:hypothetical protein n=1 Tax=Paenibacillus sp. IHB B 3415 TaxID=867080 RepID=UPI0005757DA5|nr:hypothetical protein [Paenibacillus sp. IHB B 3415]KHL95882.1 hypothetical protein QW71_09750 [Paenibacillus sp. IHB B 3415]
MKDIVITVRSGDGTFNIESIQKFEEWKNGEKNTNILLEKCGRKLFNILHNDLNYIQITTEGLFSFKFVLGIDKEETTMRLMGHIAEAIIVSRCGNNPQLNREYATYARKGKKVVRTPDKFIAIGTGHHKTKLKYASKHNPNHTQNDVIWINKENPEIELLEINNNSPGGKTAALQIKASNLKSDYIVNEIKKDKYTVPIIYFGMKDNYSKIKRKLKEYNKFDHMNFVDVRDIDEDAHEEFLEYKSIVDKLISGELNPRGLLDTQDTLLSKSALATALNICNINDTLLI